MLKQFVSKKKICSVLDHELSWTKGYYEQALALHEFDLAQQYLKLNEEVARIKDTLLSNKERV